MNSVDDIYKKKKMTALEAVRLVKNNENIIVPTGVAEPPVLLKALSDIRHEFQGVKVWQLLGVKPYEYINKETVDNVRHVSFFTSGMNRKGINEGWIDLLPCHFSDIPRMINTEAIAADSVFTLASPMNEDGYFALSLGTDYAYAAAKKTKRIFLEVNPNVPFTYGDCHVHISEVTALVESSDDVTEMKSGEISDVEKDIARHVASLVNDGDTLQIGFGSLPDAVVNQLTDKKDLGVHTEILGDGIISLWKKGIINNRVKNFHPNKMIATFAMGTKQLYQEMNHNPDLAMYPAEYVNDPDIASKNDNLVAINGIMEVDFFGQCAAESVGTYIYSSTGGQTDFVRAAMMSKGGRSIMVLPSTAKGGTISRIKATLTEGAMISTHKNDVNYVVTEYGIAQLRGQPIKERTKRLIEIAHPDFREELREEAKKRHLL